VQGVIGWATGSEKAGMTAGFIYDTVFTIGELLASANFPGRGGLQLGRAFNTSVNARLPAFAGVGTRDISLAWRVTDSLELPLAVAKQLGLVSAAAKTGGYIYYMSVTAGAAGNPGGQNGNGNDNNNENNTPPSPSWPSSVPTDSCAANGVIL
jgi:hypothetical protein